MTRKKISGGIADVHELPADLKRAIGSNAKVCALWDGLTPLARNEWICWVVSVKGQETRDEHVRRVSEDLLNGKRRPCCWLGCIHRKDKAMSSTQKWVMERKEAK